MSIKNKFRAWCKKDNCMLDWLTLSQTAFNQNDQYSLLYNVLVNHKYYYEVMQCLGVEDKNKKDIYEGDIIELVNADGERIRVICEYGIARRHIMGAELMEVDIPGFYFKLPNGKKSFPMVNNYLGKHDLEIFEVIGNIYENPDLIHKT